MRKNTAIIAYCLGQMTAYGLTTDTEAVIKQIRSHAQQENLQIQVTDQEVEKIIKTLMEMRAIIKPSTVLPYG